MYLSIYLSNYRASYRLFFIPWYKFAIPCLHLDWRLKIEDSTETPSSNLQSSRGDWRSEEKILWNLHSEGEKASICLPIPFHSIRPSVHPSILSIYPYCPSIHPSFPFIYISTYLAICSPIYLPIYLAIYLSIHPSNYTFIQRCNPWVACGLKIQERTIFSPKKGTEGTDNKKHWEASKPTIKQNCTGFDTY